MKNLPAVEFYFIRHGQTDANANGLMCGGDWDIKLNDTGHRQSIKASNLLLKLKDNIEAFYVSPMKRALQTAHNLNQINAEIVIENDLIEWRVGDWEYQPWDEVPNPFSTTEDPPNGETRLFFEERVIFAVHRILTNEKRKVLIVSHGAVAHVLFTSLGMDQVKIENSTLYHVKPDGMSWTLERVSM